MGSRGEERERDAKAKRGKERGDNTEREQEERVCVFMSDSVQCKQLGCCLSPQPSNTVILFSLSHLQWL